MSKEHLKKRVEKLEQQAPKPKTPEEQAQQEFLKRYETLSDIERTVWHCVYEYLFEGKPMNRCLSTEGYYPASVNFSLLDWVTPEQKAGIDNLIKQSLTRRERRLFQALTQKITDFYIETEKNPESYPLFKSISLYQDLGVSSDCTKEYMLKFGTRNERDYRQKLETIMGPEWCNKHLKPGKAEFKDPWHQQFPWTDDETEDKSPEKNVL